jgi:DTW domain-containing protein YfiP
MTACLCRWVTPTDNRVPVLVLQHPAEAQETKGSARLLGLSLACSTASWA